MGRPTGNFVLSLTFARRNTCKSRSTTVATECSWTLINLLFSVRFFRRSNFSEFFRFDRASLFGTRVHIKVVFPSPLVRRFTTETPAIVMKPKKIIPIAVFCNRSRSRVVFCGHFRFARLKRGNPRVTQMYRLNLEDRETIALHNWFYNIRNRLFRK